MAIKITDDCICCEACEPECPNNAIYAPEEAWKFSDGTTMENDEEMRITYEEPNARRDILAMVKRRKYNLVKDETKLLIITK